MKMRSILAFVLLALAPCLPLAAAPGEPSSPARTMTLVRLAEQERGEAIPVSREHPFETVVSADGRFVGLSDRPRSGGLSFRLFTAAGDLLWKSEHEVAFDVPEPLHRVSVRGTTARLSRATGELTFLDRRGREIARLSAGTAMDHAMQGSWSPTGRAFALLSGGRERGHRLLTLFSGGGEREWMIPFEDGRPRGLLFTPGGEGLLVSHYEMPSARGGVTSYSSRTGQPQWTLAADVSLGLAAFSDDGGLLLLPADPRAPKALLVDPASGEVLFARRLEHPIHAARLYAGENAVHLLSVEPAKAIRRQAKSRPVHRSAALVALDLEGHLTGTAPLTGLEAAPGRLRILPESTAEVLVLEAADRIIHYRLSR